MDHYVHSLEIVECEVRERTSHTPWLFLPMATVMMPNKTGIVI